MKISEKKSADVINESNLEPFNVEEVTVTDDMLKMLKPYEEATVLICKESYVTISKIIPLVKGLKKQLAEMLVNSDEGDDLHKQLKYGIVSRLIPYESRKHCLIGTLLDPNYDILAFTNSNNCQTALNYVERDLNASSTFNNSSQATEKATKRKYTGLFRT